MDKFETVILNALENAAISGLCRDGQLEIGVQEARKIKPDLTDQELYRRVIDLYEDWQDL